jgi:hypothetical protein
MGLWGKRRHLLLVCLEVRLAHTIEVTLSLLSAAFDSALAGLGAVTLTETLRLDDASAVGCAAVTTLVFEKLVSIC